MTAFLLRLFEGRHPEGKPGRDRYGAFAGLVGVVCNLLLFFGKLLVGLFSGSVSVMADAVNNLSDATSSIVTLVGFRLSQRPADKEHPYGHARIEYMAGAFVGIVILLVGVEFLKSSIDKILHPSPVSFTLPSLLLLLGAVLLKLWMQAFYRGVGKKIDSPTLVVAAQDSRNDVITTIVVLLGAVVQYGFHLQIDGYLGTAVALFIIVSGVLSLKETLSPLLGEAPPQALVDGLSRDILAYPGVLGIHDLLVHSYGPEKIFATVHVEMAADTDPLVSHGVIDRIERQLGQKHHLTLVVHYDPVERNNEETEHLRQAIERIVRDIHPALTIHDLRIAKTASHTNVIFDVAVPPDCPCTPSSLTAQIDDAVRALDAHYHPIIQLDQNYTSYHPRS